MNRFRLPNHLLVEEGIFSRIPDVMADVMPDLGKKKTILVTEENLVNIFGKVLDEIKEDFEDIEMYLIKVANYDNAVALAKYVTMNDIKVVIGFGGGTVLDLAKFAAFVSRTKLISLPTTLSNDSLSSPVAVLGTEGKARKTFKCTIPDSILVDVNLITSAPMRQLLAGVGDTISKYTAISDWKLAQDRGRDHVDDFSCMISKMAFNSVCYNDQKDLKSRDFIKRLTQALVMGGLAMEIAGSSRPSSGSEHLFCHSLEENFGEYVTIPHGIAVAMGTYIAVQFQNRNVDKVIKVIKDYDLPVNPTEWNLTKDIFIKAWQQAPATRADRYTIINEADLSDENLGRMYDEMVRVFS